MTIFTHEYCGGPESQRWMAYDEDTFDGIVTYFNVGYGPTPEDAIDDWKFKHGLPPWIRN